MDSGTLIGSLVGFFAALLPELLDFVSNYFKPKQTPGASPTTVKKRGSETTRLEEEEEGVVPAAAEAAELHATTKEKRHHMFLELLRGTVRPFITYQFFALFALIHIWAFYHGMFVDHTPIVQLLPVVWSEGTESLLAVVLSFWFGSRAITTLRKK
jgi:hypothetical protein